jgi:hypothetical protein
MQLSKSLNKLFLIIALLGFFLAIHPKKTEAAIISLDPQNANVSVNANFDVKVNLDTKADNTTAVDLILNYDPAMLEISNVTFSSPTLFPVNTKTIDNTNGKLLITSTQQDAINSYSGNNTLAVLTMRMKAPGSASLIIACEINKTNDSNVFKTGTSLDVLECGNLQNGLYTTSGTIVTNPTRAPLPAPGNIGPLGMVLGAGAIFIGIGALLVFAL